jgi:tRNA pseudouridine55 synthase
MTGEVLREAEWQGIGRADLEAVLQGFRGMITQVPPMFSAIKRDGQPLYKLARQGQTVEREPRTIEIFSLELICFEPPMASFRVVCSRGTYVRTLADDIGNRLGCGAALKELRRTASGPFAISAAVTLEQLEQAAGEERVESLVVSPSSALVHLPQLQVAEAAIGHIRHGRSPLWGDLEAIDQTILAEGELIRLTRDGELLAVAQYHIAAGLGERVVLKRVFL